MYLVLKYLFLKLPLVDTLYFYSDGPSNQYRNKNIFFYISTTLPEVFPHLQRISCNYSECGHGKGVPPDGLGGTLKRTADRIVAQGTDIADFTTFVKTLNEHCKGIKILVIDKEIIENESKNNGIKFKGTMKVHQVNWCRSDSTLKFHHISCIECRRANTKYCNHFEIGKICIKNKHVNTDIQTTSKKSLFSIGDRVLVHYDSKLYPGEILRLLSGEVEINAMAYIGIPRRFKWPRDMDSHCYPITY